MTMLLTDETNSMPQFKGACYLNCGYNCKKKTHTRDSLPICFMFDHHSVSRNHSIFLPLSFIMIQVN